MSNTAVTGVMYWVMVPHGCLYDRTTGGNLIKSLRHGEESKVLTQANERPSGNSDVLFPETFVH